jgi:hypothetical protein
MVSPVSSFSVVYALAFLLPGFLAFKITKHQGRIITEEDRFDKAVYTVGASGLSLIIGLSVYQLATNGFAFQIEQEYAPIEIGGIYLLSLMSSVVLGVTIGRVYDWIFHESLDIRNPPVWKLQAENRVEPTQVRVVMKSGREIWGEMYVHDSPVQGKDVILQYPENIVRNEDGTVWKRVGLDEYVFLSGEQISEIYYETELDI